MKFAQVILPLSLHDAYTYAIPTELQSSIAVGKRVMVQFGKSKLYAAMVIELSSENYSSFEVKEILEVLDSEPIINPDNLNLWNWIASYYCCNLGDVFRAAIPSGLKIESKSFVKLLTKEIDKTKFTPSENAIIASVFDKASSIKTLEKDLENQFSYVSLKNLIDHNIISLEERIQKKYSPKKESYIKLHPSVEQCDLSNIAETLNRAPKQKYLLQKFLSNSKIISKKSLLNDKNVSNAVINALISKNILQKFEKNVSRLSNNKVTQASINYLNKHQVQSLAEIKGSFEKNKVALLHGVTASGKTEIYIQLIKEVIAIGGQVLYLLPEIALTTQLAHRITEVFGDKVGIYHSKFNDHERVEVWKKVLLYKKDPQNGFQIILGARSAIFLPFSNLKLTIVDEEHENSYKQFDPAPRYNARDTAIYMSSQLGANVLLGSATPSFESYFNALTNKYKLVELKHRHTNVQLPEMVIADVKRAYKKREMRSLFSPQLYNLIDEALKLNEQIILFQNRRGYSPFIECFDCGWVPTCKKCSVSLTYHYKSNLLNCHYCGYSQHYPTKCPKCGSLEIKKRGFGTEKVQQEVKSLFKNARVARMDYDTTQSKHAFQNIITKLENNKIDILIGTQMVTKGLDFSNVSVVGILNADNILNFPDFRAYERAYQLISQVAGRAGRAHKRGKVIIQTSQADHLILELIKNQNYKEIFETTMEERKLFNYPPFYKLVKISVKHKDKNQSERISEQLKDVLIENKELIVLGPEFPMVNRIQLWFIKELWIKISRQSDITSLKHFIKDSIQQVKQLPHNSGSMINIDVDPL